MNDLKLSSSTCTKAPSNLKLLDMQNNNSDLESLPQREAIFTNGKFK